jgi:hypothetical protein
MTIELAKCDAEVDIYSLARQPVRWDILALYRKDAYLSEAEESFFEIAGEVFSQMSFLRNHRGNSRMNTETG